MQIDLGGGTLPAPGYINLDPGHGEGPWRIRAQDGPWPCEPGTVDRVRASHVLEHIPNGSERIATFNNVWHALRLDGIFEIIVPTISHLNALGVHEWHPGWQAWADPTHVSFWVFPESLLYFQGGPWRAHADYGIVYGWVIDSWSVESGWEGHATMRKVAPQ